MKISLAGISTILAAIAVIIFLARSWAAERERRESLHYQKTETRIIVSSPENTSMQLFHAGDELNDAKQLPEPISQSFWLPSGNYFLKVLDYGDLLLYPIALTGYRSGPDKDGDFIITIRQSTASPPTLTKKLPQFVHIPSGFVLLGDRRNPQEPHYVWLSGFYMGCFEVSNEEFQRFFTDKEGYANDSNWTKDGIAWKQSHATQATALLTAQDQEFNRFGKLGHPVVRVNWYEASAFCRWMTRELGNHQWLFSLPSEAQWEKAARGPDNFDYGLGNKISDPQSTYYNWKKNPDALVTVQSIEDSKRHYLPNRYGLYHMSGNVTEWTTSIFLPYNSTHPYVEEERNREDLTGLRVARGGSWYSASIALLSVAYRDAFSRELRNQDLGFRVVARRLP